MEPVDFGTCPMVSKRKRNRSHTVLSSQSLQGIPPLKFGQISWKSGMHLHVCTACEAVILTARDSEGKATIVVLSPPKQPAGKGKRK